MPNNSRKKIRVAVLYGGRSGEHEVSLQSAAYVVKNLDPERYEIVPIGIDKQGRWLLNDIKHLEVSAATKFLTLQTSQSEHLPAPTQTAVAAKLFDVVFPVMHGVMCEDGTVQGLLELMDVPYVGAGVLASAVGMDKDVSKRLAAAAGLRIPRYTLVKQPIWQTDPNYYLNWVDKNFTYPVFVKPVNTGSSVGIHKVKRREDLTAAINDAFLYDVRVMVEQGLNVREIELAVLENPEYGAEPLVSLAGEVIPQNGHEFYSYSAKYLDAEGAALIIPAQLTKEQTQQAQQFAAQVFTILECEGMARVDLFMDKDNGELVFNEVNTLPGFTQFSMYPKLWEASGLDHCDLLSRLIELAIARHRRKQVLKRDWAVESN